MADPLSQSCTAFDGFERIAHGQLVDVALAVRSALSRNPRASILVFGDETGAVIDLDLRGTTADIVSRLAETKGRQHGRSSDGEEKGQSIGRGRGRPRLGVVAREVTLLPRHWQWLAKQRGGASAALRRLVDEARHVDGGRTRTRVSQERAYRFMSAMAGNLAGFEEAARALFAGERKRFERHTATWPADVRAHASRLAWTAAAEHDASQRQE